MWHYGYGMAGSGWFGWLPAVLLILLIAIAVVFLVRMLDGRGERRPPAEGTARPPLERGADDPAQRILRERYARGEIDREEFQQRQHDLR